MNGQLPDLSVILKVNVLGLMDSVTVVALCFEHDYRLLLGFEYSL